MSKMSDLDALITPKMLQDAKKCKDAKEIKEKIITPNLARINDLSGQENSADYLAYLTQYLLTLKRIK